MAAGAPGNFSLPDRLIRAVSNWRVPGYDDDDVEELLDSGADVNGQHGTLLPLQCACMVQDEECVQLLLDRGAQVNQVDGFGRAAIHYAADRRTPCLQLLLNHNNSSSRSSDHNDTAATAAANANVNANVNAPVADVNIPDAGYATPLHWASYKNNVACVRMLLQHGADVHAAEMSHHTPLSWALQLSSVESVKVLLQYNARPDAINHNGRSPLRRAIHMHVIGLTEDVDDVCLELLIQACGRLELRDGGSVWPKKLKDNNKLMELLRPLVENVRPLRHLCRYAIRMVLGPCYLPNVVPKLPIPPLLQEYLLLQL